ncbi:MAG: pyridoxal phosphate-dependent aminotransferase, partial [Patescibacteria group bacterium]|nr:pyridoxal phosphate-dependent aminotransferase [Patescibacteria group bacterium]
MNLSKRLSTIPPSPIRKLVPFAEQAKKQGVTVYHLNIGDPDIQTPKEMIDVLRHWSTPTISYAQSKGDPEFLSALAWYYQ